MALSPGTKLGPYEILSPLGAGGMGEVYCARDTRLGREVAVKVLPQRLASSPDFRQRFEREARAVSSLQHPHICVLHDIGHDDATGEFLVMELLEGETAAERLKRGRLPLQELLKIGMQVADALDKAHRKGVVHRDLKPANIMLTKSGAKLMDFGLAKPAAQGPAGGSGSAPLLSAALTADGPSPASPITSAGTIIGTIQYMSPEQIEGKEADARSDIFAFGATLYEMATGVRAFEGKSQISVASAILEKEPDPVSKSQPLAPSALDRMVAQCLAKNPDDRFQSAHDVGVNLKWISESAVGAGLSRHPENGNVKSPLRALPWGLAGLAAAAFLILLLIHWRSPAPTSWTGTMLGGPTLATSPRLSPDGRLLAFLAKDPNDVIQVWVMQPDSGSRVMLTHNRERGLVEACSWSPDGGHIYYDRWYDQPKGIFTVPALGGDEQLVLENAMSPEALADGSLLVTRISSENRYQVFRYWPDSGQLRAYPLEVRSALGNYTRAVPGGREALVVGTKIGTGAATGEHVNVLDLASGSVRELPEDFPGEFGGYFVTSATTRDGKFALISAVNGSMYRVVAIPLDGHGPSHTLLNLMYPVYSLDTAPDGSIYLDQNNRGTDLVRFSADGGRVERLASLNNPDDYNYFTVLPDGRAVWSERAGARVRLLLVESGKDPTPLINTTEDTAGPMTPVGSDQLAFMIGVQPRHEIALAALSNGRITRRLNFDQGVVTELAASPDAKTLFVVAEGAVWSVPLEGGTPRRLRSGDGVAVDAATQSLVIEVREPPNSRLVRLSLAGGPEQEISGTIHLGNLIDAGSVRNGKLVAPLSAPTWYWPPAMFDLVTGKSARIPLDYTNDFHHMTWTPDGKIMAVAAEWRATLWKFSPQGNQ